MLDSKKIIITGASRGIGRAIAYASAKQGAIVGINYLNSAKEALDLQNEIISKGYQNPLLLKFDACNSVETEKSIQKFLDIYHRIDGWVNNACINISGLLPLLTEEEINQQIHSALIGPVLCCKSILPRMLLNKKGSIVNIGSIVTEKVFRGQSVYAAAKGGLVSFTKALDCEYFRKGIRINCVQPGPTDTDMMKTTKKLAAKKLPGLLSEGLFCSREEIAGVVCFLLSDWSAGIHGITINVDGGYANL